MTIIVAAERMKQDGGVAYNNLKQEGGVEIVSNFTQDSMRNRCSWKTSTLLLLCCHAVCCVLGLLGSCVLEEASFSAVY
jgi:ornithine carbamoyltransferase